MNLCRLAALVLGSAVAAACSGGHSHPAVVVAGERHGLSLLAEVSANGDSLIVETRLRNERKHTLYLDADQCDRVTEALLVRTKFEPKGRTWSGSVQAAKKLVLNKQVAYQAPDRFAPRVPGDRSSRVPDCVRPHRPRKLAPGKAIAERWELPLRSAQGIAEVGSSHTVVRVEAVEARARDDLHYLDILPTGEAEGFRAGRSVRVEEPVSSVIYMAPSTLPEGPSLGQLYDRLLENAALRSWIRAQPARSWRLADFSKPSPYSRNRPAEQVRLKLVATRYERAAVATARADGTDVSVDLPTERDRARALPRRAGTIPPGIKVIDEPKGYVLRQDILPGSITLPSGRVVVGEYLFEEKPLPLRVAPGSYPVYVTLARYREGGPDTVALGTLVLSRKPTTRWKRAGSIAVDGGTATITSPEAVAVLNHTFDRDHTAWQLLDERIFDSVAAHDYLGTHFSLRPHVDLVEMSSGNGDGGYPVYIGYDAAGGPTRVVVDFYLLHLDWP
jgi:hypothetical protein